MKVAVVIVNYRQEEYLPALLASVDRQTFREVDVCVVNTAPSGVDVPQEIVRIDRHDNPGYGVAANDGIRWGMGRGCDAFLLLNADVRLHEECLARLVEAPGDVVQPLILLMHRPDRINAAGLQPTPLGVAYCRRYLRRKETVGLSPSPIPAASGSAMFIHRRVIERVGMFDPSFFLYLEDVDLSLRSRCAGFKILLEPRAIAWHRYRPTVGGGKLGHLWRGARIIRERFSADLRWR